MPALANKSYFNYGGQGPLPSSSLEAINDSWAKLQELGPFTNNVWPYVSHEIYTTKQKLAEICGVTQSRIALTENVTSGCVLPLLGLPFSPGDHLLISDCEHPGVVAACKELAKQKGLSIDILPVQGLRQGVDNTNQDDLSLLTMLEKCLTPKTRLVAISHILWNTGKIIPIKLVADLLLEHPNKPYLLVDAAQSFGQISIKDAASVADIYGFTGHKWACGPEGLGGVAISERVLEESISTLIGWRSLKKEESIYQNNNNQLHHDARRFEVATSCIPLLAGLRCSLDLLEKEGNEMERIEKIRRLSKKLWNQLNAINNVNTVLEGPPPSGLVSFSMISNYSPKKIVDILGEESLWIRVLEDPIWLRACLHITSTEQEIDVLTKGIKKLVEGNKL